MATAPDLEALWTTTDPWSGLDHKQGMGHAPIGRVGSWVAPTWIDVGTNRRRLTAYRILDDYYKSKARTCLNTEDEQIKQEHRELGDAALMVESQLTALLGATQTIVVPGADDVEADAKAIERQDFFDEWARKERFVEKMREAERDAVKLGDAVYVLEADTRRGRVRLRLRDPGFYFPELDPRLPEDDYPERVHLAGVYELPEGSGQMFLERTTFWLGPIMPKLDVETRMPLVDENGMPILFDGDVLDSERGTITRQLPWNEEPTDVTCYMSRGVWRLEDVDGYNVYSLPDKGAAWATNADGDVIHNLDLGWDFIPVIHEPNTVAIRDHFGTAALTPIAQTLDELAAADTDAAKAAALAGVPAVVVKGIGVKALAIKPGAVIPIGEDSDFEVIDLSPALTAISGYVERIQARVSENGRVPDEWLGRVKSSEVPSGFAMALGFSPLRSLVDEMRLTRDEKYSLLLKFVQRLSILFGWLDGDVFDAEVQFGSFLPSDEQATATMVTALYTAHLISRATAIRMLVEAGVIDSEIDEEITAAQNEDFDAALALAEATNPANGGDLAAVYDLLGLGDPPDAPAPAEPSTADLGLSLNLPNAPGDTQQ